MDDRKLDICRFCETPTWCYKTKAGPMCRACHVERFFARILYPPLGLKLLEWQRQDLREIYGAVDMETGLRRYRSAYLEVPKKNGKSFLIGGLPLYHLTMEHVENPQAYGAAAAKDQAGIVYTSALRLLKANPLLKEQLKPLESTKRILRKDGAGFYAVISADGDLQDGIEPSLVIKDELHRWKTAKAHTLHEVLTAGTISRREPLDVEITTAGDIHESPICWQAHIRAREFMEGAIKSDRFYAHLWGADEKKLKEDPEYWKSRQARVDANPSHVDRGGFLEDAAIAEMIEKLGEAPYKRYHQNIWNQKSDRWMPADKWAACGGELRALTDRPCYIGVDLSKNTDFTSIVAVFPSDDGSMDVLPFFWIPEEQIPKLEKRLRIDLKRWIAAGLLETTPGPAIRKEAIIEKIRMLSSICHVLEICYDPRFAWEFITDLVDEGYTCIEVKQWGRLLDAPMQWLMGKVLEGQVRHGAHEILDWNMDCLSVRIDKDGLMAPAKEHLARDSKRIDGVSALINACFRVMLRAETPSAGAVVVSM